MASVLHFSGYYRYMEEVEHAFWRACGLSVMTRNNGGGMIGWPRVATSCEHFEPVRFEEEVELALRVASVGERSVSYAVEFRRDGKRIALGRTTAVCSLTNGGSFEAIRIPDEFRARLEEML